MAKTKRIFKPRDKRAEAAARPRQASADWEARKASIRAAYGVKLPERTPISSETIGSLKVDDLISKDPLEFTMPAPADYSEEMDIT